MCGRAAFVPGPPCKRAWDDKVLKELAIYATVSNLVRVVMMEAATRQGVDIERISLVDLLLALRNDKRRIAQIGGQSKSTRPF